MLFGISKLIQKSACLLMMCCLIFVESVAASQPEVKTAESLPNAQQALTSSPTQLSANIPVIRDAAKGKSDDFSVVWVITCFALTIGASYLLIKLKSGSIVLWGRRLNFEQRSESVDLRLKKQLMLTAKTSLHVVSWRGEELLLACTDSKVTLLDRKEVSPVICDSAEFDRQQKNEQA
ncbi:flagellar biosynthetic protein FliO [Undibacterium sp. Ji49W]|uniref:flagellar biosynthetic protein FliO n=1 Tax=Undibacterium sp. Ji49W TaxID=3413040 RepID=UPI003BF0CE91